MSYDCGMPGCQCWDDPYHEHTEDERRAAFEERWRDEEDE